MKVRDRRKKKIKWTPEMMAYVREHYPTENTREIARCLGVSQEAVWDKANQMGVTKEQTKKKMVWTPEKVEYLVKHYPTGKIVEIAKHLNCHTKSVQWKAARLGLVRIPKNPYRVAKKAKPDKPKYYGCESRIGMNQAEVTDATRTVICSCALDGMTVKQTATMTERAIEQVRAVLKECQESGYLDWIKSRRESGMNIRHDRSACRMCSGFANAGTE